MAKKKSTYLSGFTSSSKLIMKKWAPFAELVVIFSSGSSDQQSNSLLDERLLVDAFNGVFSFCFRDLSRLLTELEQATLLMRADLDDSLTLPQEIRERLGAKNAEPMRYALPKLEKAMKQTLAKISPFAEYLKRLHADCAEQFTQALREQEVLLNQNEQDELAMIETHDALIKRLDALALPPIEPDTVFSLASYFQVKSSIVLKNALSRNHQKHGQNEINQQLRRIKSAFDSAKKLQAQFEKEYIAPIAVSVKEALSEH